MKEKLQSLPVSELRGIAKENGIKSVTTLRKQQLVDMILEVTEKQEQEKKQSEEKKAEKKKEEKQQDNKEENQQDSKEETAKKQPKRNEYKRNDRNKDKRHGKRTRDNAKSGDNKQGNNQRRQNKVVENKKGTEDTENTETINEEDVIYKTGILELLPDGYGFLRCDNYLSGDEDAYVSASLAKKCHLKTGDYITGRVKKKRETEKYGALYYVDEVNGEPLDKVYKRPNFEDLTPIFPDERLHLETDGHSTAMRIVDLVSPIGKGQRGMIVSPPKAGKTTLVKEIAKAVLKNNPEMEMIILLIDERPEEVTDIKEAIKSDNVQVIYSTFDELPEHHKKVSEMVMERAKRLVEHGKDVIILLDSITRLARAYNITVPPSGRTLSGGLDPAALHMPKKFFGAARNMREGGSLTVLATALVDTGSKMDDVVYEEFKGTGNMELVLDRKLSEKRIFPAVDIVKSGTRREDLLLNSDELGASYIIRKELNGMRKDEAVEQILNLFSRTKSNKEFIEKVSRIRHKYSNYSK